ncbi:AMOTL1 (predicted) [Pycnogonum litorale]
MEFRNQNMSSSHQPPPLYSNSNKARLHYPKSFRQSFSGSETDVSNSTSTENLTQEEKHVLQHSTRQEPQGEENTVGDKSHHDHQRSSSYGINSATSSSNNTLIIHDFKSFQNYLASNNKVGDDVAKYVDIHGVSSNNNNDGGIETRSGSVSPLRSFHALSNEPVVAADIKKLTDQPPNYEASNIHPHFANKSLGRRHQLHHTKYYVNEDVVINSEFMKRYNIEVGNISQQPVVDSTGLPPPPEYPKSLTANVKKLCISDSDLTSSDRNRPETRGFCSLEEDNEYIHHGATHMVEALSAENIVLKEELDHYYMKVSKLRKVENEVVKVHSAHEELVRSSEKREKLERAVRMRLELEIKRLQENNKRLKDQVDIALTRFTKDQASEFSDVNLKKELNKRDVLISQLITQNKELVSTKERQEVELSAQRATLQEQRTHIDILDNALTNAQANVVRLEEECRKKHAYVERVSQLQKALTSLQEASDKRDVMEKKLRAKLEKEIDTLRKQKDGKQSTGESASKESEMKKQIRQNEEKIISLEAEVFKWEQRYLEESAIRQISIDNASMPKDAKIAALEKTSQESVKLIAEARTDKLKQMDELYQTQRKCADIEAKIKDLESKLAEKDAMIKVLQKQTLDKSEVLQSAMLRSPRHSPHPSSIFHASSLSSPHTDVEHGAPPLNNSLGTSTLTSTDVAPNVETSTLTYQRSCGQRGTVAISVPDSSVQVARSRDPSSGAPTNSTEKSLDEQLRDVESQLSSKDSIINALRAEKEKYPNHFWRV